MSLILLAAQGYGEKVNHKFVNLLTICVVYNWRRSEKTKSGNDSKYSCASELVIIPVPCRTESYQYILILIGKKMLLRNRSIHIVVFV